MQLNEIKRIEEKYFKDIHAFPYLPKYYYDNNSFDTIKEPVRIAYIDETSNNNVKKTLLFLHGHPTWSYLWRHLIPIGLKNDYRIVAPDLPGFGRSDKFVSDKNYTFKSLRQCILSFIDALDLKNIILVTHEWGGTLGLTIPMAMPERFNRVVCFNSYIATGTIKVSESYKNWIKHNKFNKDLNVRALMARTNRILSLAECNAYNAPFPDKSYKTSLRVIPSIFPLDIKSLGADISQEAHRWWLDSNTLEPSIVICGMKDPLIPIDNMKELSNIISSNGVINTVSNAGHFVPEWGMEFGNSLFKELNS